MKELLTVKDVAEALGLSTNTVYKYLNAGAIRASRAQLKSGRFRIPKKAVEEFVGMPLEQLAPAQFGAESDVLPLVDHKDTSLPPPTPPEKNEYMHVLESLLTPAAEKPESRKESPEPPQSEIIRHAHYDAPSFTIKTARVLLALALGMLALNLLFFTVPEPLTLFTLLIVFFLFLLLSYQYGGMQRRT